MTVVFYYFFMNSHNNEVNLYMLHFLFYTFFGKKHRKHILLWKIDMFSDSHL